MPETSHPSGVPIPLSEQESVAHRACPLRIRRGIHLGVHEILRCSFPREITRFSTEWKTFDDLVGSGSINTFPPFRWFNGRFSFGAVGRNTKTAQETFKSGR